MTRPAKQVARVGIALFIALATVAVTAGIARADGGELLVATPGSVWGATVAKPLFAAHTYVPGDNGNAEFRILNNSSSKAALRVELVNAWGSPALMKDLLLKADSPDGSGRVVDLRGAVRGNSALMFTKRAVDPHEVVRMHLRLSLPASSGNDSMRGHAGFAVRVVLGDSRIVLPGRQPAGTDHPDSPVDMHPSDGASVVGDKRGSGNSPLGNMPVTGGEMSALLLLAAILLGTGTAAAIATGKKRKDRS